MTYSHSEEDLQSHIGHAGYPLVSVWRGPGDPAIPVCAGSWAVPSTSSCRRSRSCSVWPRYSRVRGSISLHPRRAKQGRLRPRPAFGWRSYEPLALAFASMACSRRTPGSVPRSQGTRSLPLFEETWLLYLPVAQILGLSGGKWRRTGGFSEFLLFAGSHRW